MNNSVSETNHTKANNVFFHITFSRPQKLKTFLSSDGELGQIQQFGKFNTNQNGIIDRIDYLSSENRFKRSPGGIFEDLYQMKEDFWNFLKNKSNVFAKLGKFMDIVINQSKH